MNVNLHYLFPTAVAALQSDNHAKYKEALYARMPNHRVLNEDGSGWVYGEEVGKVYVHTDEVLAEFFSFVSRGVGAYLDQLAFDRSRVDINIVKTWFSVTDRTCVTPPHAHATSHVSFVYYINMPKEADALAFQVPASPNELFYAAFEASTLRQKSLVLQRNLLNSNQSIVPVTEGQLIVFPSHLKHGTIKMGDMGEELRIAVAGDVLLVFNEQNPNYTSGVFNPRTWRVFS